MSYPQDLNDLAYRIHNNAVNKGFFDGPERNIGEMLALIHSEVSEALEAQRVGDMEYHEDEHHKPLGFGSELADIIIRTLDLAEHLGFNINQIVLNKMAYNETRPFKHGKAF